MAWLREVISKSPWLGWGFALICLGVAVFFMVRGGGGGSPYSPERMQEMVTIKFTDTGDEIQMLRGDLDRQLRRRDEGLDPTKGLINPKTGQPTGFPYDKSEWEGMISRIVEQRKRLDQAESAAPAAGPGAPATK
ncbi:MAG: hypothetical protein SFY96_06450 [Planctomycetota bacterium]|nr:hypothetical protein [Planctomycetota bacterium]